MCGWIDWDEVPELAEGERLTLFGAGLGSVRFLEGCAERGLNVEIAAVIDNDPSLQGKHLGHAPIFGPSTLADLAFDRILVTTVSGREAVAEQLRRLGYVEGSDFWLVGSFPSSAGSNLDLFLQHLAPRCPRLEGLRALHIGPGGFFGLECCLAALGLAPTALDAFSFNLRYPDVTSRWPDYRRMGEEFPARASAAGLKTAGLEAAWRGVFEMRGERTLIREQVVDYRYPHRFSSLPFDDGHFDVLVSFAVLEHVRRPEAAVAESLRVLAPGGYALHKIVTRDHRAFSRVGGFTPISYLRSSAEEWEAINRDKFHQNRLLPSMWRELFQREGFELLEYAVLGSHPATEDELAGLHDDYRGLPPELLAEMDCLVVARKPA